jgi:hypothetical protein
MMSHRACQRGATGDESKSLFTGNQGYRAGGGNFFTTQIRMVPSWAAGAGAGVPQSPAPGRKAPALRGMVPSPTPKRDHGDPQAFRLRSEGQGELVRAEGLEPSRALRPNGFSYPSTAFAAPAVLQQGLGSGLSLHRVPDVLPVVRCCPSSLYTFPTGKLIAPAGLGSGSPCYRVPRI